MKFFLSLALCKYSILSNKPTLSVWFCAEQSSLSATHFLLQWIFVNIEFIYFLKFMQDLHIPAIHAILSELHSALSTKSALFLINGISLISERWFSDFLIWSIFPWYVQAQASLLGYFFNLTFLGCFISKVRLCTLTLWYTLKVTSATKQ